MASSSSEFYLRAGMLCLNPLTKVCYQVRLTQEMPGFHGPFFSKFYPPAAPRRPSKFPWFLPSQKCSTLEWALPTQNVPNTLFSRGQNQKAHKRVNALYPSLYILSRLYILSSSSIFSRCLPSFPPSLGRCRPGETKNTQKIILPRPSNLHWGPHVCSPGRPKSAP